MIAYKQRVIDMDKLTMAHEYMVSWLKSGNAELDSAEELALFFFDMAEIMQAEADKREPKPELPSLQQTFINGVEQPRYAPSLDEWQPDWSQAPERATAWKISNHGVPMWLQSHNNINQPYVWLSDAPSFGYKGEWKNSLRKRPHGENK